MTFKKRFFNSPAVKWIAPLALALSLTLAASGAEPGKRAYSPSDVGSLGDGPPALMGTTLPEASFVTEKAKRLAKAKVVWVNWDYLRDLGIEFPPEGVTPEFEKKVLDTFAYMIPGNKDPPDAFLEFEKEVFVDRYGGTGLGVNWGSGRAHANGKTQTKGGGVTTLVGTGQTLDHAHGGASMEEAIREAIWGEVNHRELPHGSNRVLFVIDPGTVTHWDDGGQEARALIVRGNPLRPAHFMEVVDGSGPWHEVDKARTQQAWDRLADAARFDGAPAKATLKERMLTVASRFGEQFAAAYARGIYHGAPSPSNIELSGAFLDFGTETAQPGFKPIRVLDFVAPFGREIEPISKRMFQVLQDYGVRRAGAWTRWGGPFLASDLTQAFQTAYDERLRQEFLNLAGTPETLIQGALRSPKGTALANGLIALSKIDAAKDMMDKTMPPPPILDLRKVLLTLAAQGDLSDAAVREVLSPLVPETLPNREKRILELARLYREYVSELAQKAKAQGVAESALRAFMLAKAMRANRQTPALYRPLMRETNVKAVDRYLVTGDRSVVSEVIDRSIREGVRDYRDPGDFRVVLDSAESPLDGTRIDRVYDAKLGKELLVHHSDMGADGKIRFHGNEIPAESLDGAYVRYTTDGWQSQSEVRVQLDRTGRRVSFVLDLPSDGTREAVFVMRSADSKQWWKSNGRDIRIALGDSAEPATIGTCLLRHLRQLN